MQPALAHGLSDSGGRNQDPRCDVRYVAFIVWEGHVACCRAVVSELVSNAPSDLLRPPARRCSQHARVQIDIRIASASGLRFEPNACAFCQRERVHDRHRIEVVAAEKVARDAFAFVWVLA